MSEDKDNINATDEPNKVQLILTQVLITGVLTILAFLLGLTLMGWKWWGAASARDEAQKQLVISQLQNNLASAAVDARRGDYESARLSVSKFFTSATAELNKTSANVLTKDQQAELSNLLLPRDEVITLLSRNDPASAEKLAEMYVLYRKAINGETVKTQEPPKPAPSN